MPFVIALALLSFDQARLDRALRDVARAMPQTQATPVTARGPALPGARTPLLRPDSGAPADDDLVIGDVPGETLFVQGRYSHTGNIFVINDGVLRLLAADFELDGNVHVRNQGRFEADSSRLRFVQRHIYDHEVSASESSLVRWQDCTTDYNGFVFNMFAGHWARFDLHRIENQDFTTAVVMNDAQVDLDQVRQAGEWLFDGRTRGRFDHVDLLLTWYFFPSGSEVWFSFPDGDSVDGFVLDSTVPGVAGIEYHVEIDSSTEVMWAAIPEAGSVVTIDSSELRVVGIIMRGGDSTGISGLVNGLHYPDYVLPVRDRLFRVTNTTVSTWNLYAFDSCRVDLRSSIFGEFCAFDRNRVEVWSSLCDGTGGHLESSGQAFLLVAFSSASCDVITCGRSLTLLAFVAQTFGHLWATEASCLVLVNCQFPNLPVALDTGLAIVAAVSGPDEVLHDDSVAVTGSAWMVPGPFHPVEFDCYRMAWRARGDSVWNRFGPEHRNMVFRDTLEYWDTRLLQPGVYQVRVSVVHTGGDSITAEKDVRLLPTGIEGSTNTGRTVRNLSLPTLFRSAQDLRGAVCALGLESVVFDPAGRRVALLGPGPGEAPQLAPGVYFLCAADARTCACESRKLLIQP